MKILLLVLIALKGSFGYETNFTIQTTECNEQISSLANIIFTYFEYEYTVTIFDASDEKIAQIFSCTKILQPIRYFTGVSDKFFNTSRIRSRKSYPIDEGYIYRGSIDEISSSFYPKMAIQNPIAKILIIMEDITQRQARDILKEGYENFRILNSAVLIKNEAQAQDTICVYDPFYRYAIFKCLNVTNTTYKETIMKIQAFSRIRIKDLQKHQIKIYMFDSALTSKGVYNPDGTFSHFKYRDGEIIQVMAKIMNFKPVYIRPRDGSTFGYQLANGKFVGSLAAIENNLVDVLGNCRLIEEYYALNSIFLRPIATQKLVFLIQQPSSEKIMTINVFYSLDDITTGVSIFFLILLPFLYYYFHNLEAPYLNIHRRSLMYAYTYTFAIRFNMVVPLPPPVHAARIIYATIAFSGLILATIFQSSMITNLQAASVIDDIQSIDQLYQSKYEYYVPNDLKSIVKSAVIFEEMWKRNTSESLKNNSKVAAIYQETVAIDLINKYEAEESNIYTTVPESPYEYYISLIVPKNSPFQYRFNEIIIRIRESGILKHQDAIAKFDSEKYLIDRVKKGLAPSNEPKILMMADYATAFYQYLIMNAICFLVLFIEILVAPTHRKYIKSEEQVLQRWPKKYGEPGYIPP